MLLNDRLNSITKLAHARLISIDGFNLFQIRVNSVNPTIVLTVLGRRGWSDPVKKGKALERIPIGRLAGNAYYV